MALIKCPECGKEISDRAEACPNCAYPIAQLSGNHKTSEETEKTQGIVVKKSIDASTHVERPEMTEEELRAREERRRKKREAALIKKRKARRRKIIIISCIAVALMVVASFLIFDIAEIGKQTSSSSNGANNQTAFSEKETAEVSDEIPVNKRDIVIGQEVSVPDQYVFTVESAEFTTKISETHGDWVYGIEVEDEENTYLAIKINIKNLTTEPISSFALNTPREPNNGLGVDVEMVYNDKYNYDGHYSILNNNDISPLASGIVYAYFEVPKMIATDTGSIVVTLDVMGTLYTLNVR